MNRSAAFTTFYEEMESALYEVTGGIHPDLQRTRLHPYEPSQPLCAQNTPVEFHLDLQRLHIVHMSRSTRSYNRGESNYYIMDMSIVNAVAGTIMAYKSGFRPIRNRERVLVGRAFTQNEFRHTDYVSNKHALIIREGDYFTIRDLGSTNGTYLLEH